MRHYTVCPFLVIMVEMTEWSLFLLSNDWIDPEQEKTWFLLILIQVLSYVVAGFYNCKLPLNVLLYISIFVFRARAWLNQWSILSAEEGKSFMLKNVFYKSVCYSFPASIIPIWNKAPKSWSYTIWRYHHFASIHKNRNWCLKAGHLLKLNFLLISTKSIC